MTDAPCEACGHDPRTHSTEGCLVGWGIDQPRVWDTACQCERYSYARAGAWTLAHHPHGA